MSGLGAAARIVLAAALPLALAACAKEKLELVKVVEEADPSGKDYVSRVGFSADGSAAFAVRGEKLFVWETAGWTPQAALDEPDVDAASLSPDGTRLYVANRLDPIEIRDVRTGRLIAKVDEPGAGTSYAFDPAGARAAFGCASGACLLYDVAAGRELGFAGEPIHNDLYPTDVMGVRFSSDGKRLYAVVGAQEVKIWDAATRKLIRSFKTEPRERMPNPDGTTTFVRARTGAFSADAKLVLIADGDGVLRLYDTDTGGLEREFRGHRVADVDYIRADLDPAGRRAISTAHDGTVRLWDARGGGQLDLLDFRAENTYGTALAFSPDGRAVLVGMRTGETRLYRLVDRRR